MGKRLRIDRLRNNLFQIIESRFFRLEERVPWLEMQVTWTTEKILLFCS